MATYAVTYTTGQVTSVEADDYEESGSWLTFTKAGRDELTVSAQVVQEIRPIGAPPPAALPAGLRWPAVTVLAAVAAFGILVGAADLFAAETEAGRVLGLALLVAGLAGAAGALGLAEGSDAGLRRGLVGAAAAAAAALTVAAVWGSGGGNEPVVPVAGAVVVLTALALGLALWGRGVRPKLPTVARGFLAAGVVIGLFQFWYDKQHLPATKEAGLSESIELEAGPAVDGDGQPDFVTATVTLKNVSGTKVRVLGSHYVATAFEPGQHDEVFVEHGPLDVGVGNWFGPDQQYQEKVVIRVPDGGPAALRFTLDVHVTKGDRLPHGRRVECDDGDACPVAWEIGENSLLKRLTRESRYIVHQGYVTTDGPDDAHLVTCISRSPDSCTGPDPKLNDVYGRVTIGASAEVLLAGDATAA
jgi:hypothetical protein